MKKLLTLLFAVALACSLSFAQAAPATEKPADTTKAEKKETKKKAKAEKKEAKTEAKAEKKTAKAEKKAAKKEAKDTGKTEAK